MARILAVDPGDKNIGIAISDPTGTIASPLRIIRHRSREKDALAIIDIATENQAGLVIIGYSLNDEGEPTFQGRKSVRLAAAIRSKTQTTVVLWDESLTTQDAIDAARKSRNSTSSRGGHQDDIAAAIILQSYLESRNS